MTITELHIVIGKDGFVREQDGRQSAFAEFRCAHYARRDDHH